MMVSAYPKWWFRPWFRPRPSRPHDGSLNPFSTESCDRMAEWPASACANRAIDSLFGPTYHFECLRPAPPA